MRNLCLVSLPIFKLIMPLRSHLINPRACKRFLWSADAAQNPDAEVQAVIASLGKFTDPQLHKRQQLRQRIQSVAQAEALLGSLRQQCSELEPEYALMRAREHVYEGKQMGCGGAYGER